MSIPCSPNDTPCIIKGCPITANTLYNTYQGLVDYSNISKNTIILNALKIFGYHYGPILLILLITLFSLFMANAIGFGTFLLLTMLSLIITASTIGLAYWDLSNILKTIEANKSGYNLIFSSAFTKSDLENKYKCF